MKSAKFHLGEVTFDTQKNTLTLKDGRVAQLRNKSKDVLIFLLAHPNRTVNKVDILSTVWSDVTVSDESLVQCIADIRRLIGEDSRQIVETVPRKGYRLNLPGNPEKPNLDRRFLVITGTIAVITLVASWLFWPDVPVSQGELDFVATPETSTNPPGTENTQAYLEVLKGRVSANRYSLSESLAAERNFRTAISLDPTYARAYAELGTLLAVRFENNWTVIEDADKDKALYYAEKAVSIDPELWLAHYALGRLYSLHFELDLAVSHLKSAMSLEPDNEDARAYFGIVNNFQGDAKNAVAILEQAVNSHPNPPHWYYYGLGSALLNSQRYEEAKVAFNQCLELVENSPYCLRYLIAVHGGLGDTTSAAETGREYASTGFELSIGAIKKLWTFHHPDDLAKLEAALHLAGVPE